MSDGVTAISRLTDLANPTRFLALAGRILPWLWSATLAAARRRPLYEPDGAGRLPAGLDGPHHVCPCAFRLAGHDVLHADDPLLHRHPGLAPSPGRCRGQGRCPARRGVHLHRPRHRLALGPADLGHLLGLGRAPDVLPRALHHVSRADRAGSRHRRPVEVGARRRDPDDRRLRQHSDHQVLGRLVEHAAPGIEHSSPPAARQSRPRCCGRCSSWRSPSPACSSPCTSWRCATRSGAAASPPCAVRRRARHAEERRNR